MNRILLLALLFASSLTFASEAAKPFDVQKLKLEQLESPFLLLTPGEIQALKARIASDPAAKTGYSSLLASVEGYLAKPLRFPAEEGGPRNALTCSKCLSSLAYNPESPRRHLCAKCNEWREGARLDAAWNTTTFFELSERMEDMGAAALLSGNARYATALKEAWLDLAAKYPKYRLHEKNMKFLDEPLRSSGRATCQSIEEALFITKLGYSWDALLGTKILSPEERQLIERDFWGTANAFYHRIFGFEVFGGNWGAWNCAGGLTTGVFSRDRELIDKAYNRPKAGAVPFLQNGYVLADGMVDERTSTYQTFAMEAFSRVAHVSKRLGMGFEQDPSIRAAFTAYIRFLWPDYSLACMGDSVRYRFPLADGSEKWGWARYVDLLDIGWAITQAPEILQTLQVLQAVPAVAKNREGRLYALLYGPANLKPVPFAMPSVYTSVSGMAMLRAPVGDWGVLLQNNVNPGGHSHPGALQIGMFANGEEFLPAFGACNYALRVYGEWYTRTLAKNSVSFNMLSQRANGLENQLVWGITRGPVQAVFGTSRKFQHGPDPGPPARMNRLVLLTPIAITEILRVETDSEIRNKKVTAPVNQLDAVLHFNGSLSWESPLRDAESPFQLPTLDSLRAEFDAKLKADPNRKATFSDPVSDYRHLEKPQILAAGKEGWFRGELTQPKGGKVALALFPINGGGGSAWQFMAPGFEFDPTAPLPLVMRRLAANEARFGTVAIPFRGNNPLQSVKLLVDTPSSTVLRLETAEGIETVFHSATAARLSADAGKSSSSGSLGVITEPKRGARIYTLLGESLEDAVGRLSVDAAVPVQVRLEGSRPVFANLGEQPVTVTWKPAHGEPFTKTIAPQ